MQAGTVGAVGVVKQQCRSDLADRGGAVSLGARQLQQDFLVKIVAGEVFVDVADYDVVFDERRDRVTGRSDCVSRKNGVAEGTAVAEIMPGRHG